ncbi:hypothetical protein GDO78_012073, partial [Eleutherodactylus coqui]
FDESKKEQKDREKDISDQYATTDMEPNMESMIHSKHKIGSGEQAEDARIKPGTFSMESFLNVFDMDIDNNGPFSLDSKENQTNISKAKTEGYGDSAIDEGDIKTQREPKTESQQYETNDRQSQGLSSDGLLEQHVNSQLIANTENVKLETEGITASGNILEEIYDDEDLQYILNITHNLESMKQNVSNESQDEPYVEESSPEAANNDKDLESATNVKEEHDDDDAAETSTDDVTIKQGNLINKENGVKTRIIFGDLAIRPKESATEEQNQQSDSSVNITRIRGVVTDVDYASEMTIINHNDENAEKAATALPSPLEIRSTALPRYLENSSELHVSQNDQGINVAIQKIEESLEIKSHEEPSPEVVIKALESATNVKEDADVANACTNFHCRRGKMCKTDELGNPFCACQDPNYCLPSNRNDLVCGTDNKTYTSACQLFGKKCLLEGTKEGNHLHLDYQGPCKHIPPCTEYELALFPFRMRDWLKNVLMQLYERDQENIGLLSEKQKSKVKKIYEDEKRLQEGDHNIELLAKDFQKNYHMYVYPVHWQFHQLDQHSMDRYPASHCELPVGHELKESYQCCRM